MRVHYKIDDINSLHSIVVLVHHEMILSDIIMHICNNIIFVQRNRYKNYTEMKAHIFPNEDYKDNFKKNS